MIENPLVVLFELTHAFDSLAIDYVVVGSIASSIHGEYRASGDIDIIADIRPDQIEPLVSRLEMNFYIDSQAVSNAVVRGRKFNVIHLSAVFKADIFAPSTNLGRQQLARRQLHKLDPNPGGVLGFYRGGHEFCISCTGTAPVQESPMCSGEISGESSGRAVNSWISNTYDNGLNVKD